MKMQNNTDEALIECVPNFSEGRNKATIEQIVSAIAQHPVEILDYSSDPDHNRSVVTFVGHPDAVTDAMFSGVKRASQLIDMNKHDGVHPRIGAADVIPFIPLRNFSLEDCLILVQSFAKRVGSELSIPVYLYEDSATRPERKNLAYVRKHQFEQLKTTIVSDPDREPDFGPKQLSSAGASAIGVRKILIAFNIFLKTDDVDVARDIALKIRASSGGLPEVKALGLLVDGQAQVSINLIDYRQTTLFSIMDKVQKYAQAFGVSVARSELIGMLPEKALLDTAIAYLQLPQSTHQRILEHGLGKFTGDFRPIAFE